MTSYNFSGLNNTSTGIECPKTGAQYKCELQGCAKNAFNCCKNNMVYSIRGNTSKIDCQASRNHQLAQFSTG